MPVAPLDSFPFTDGVGAVRVAIVRHSATDALEAHLDLFIACAQAAEMPAKDARIARSWRIPLAALRDGELVDGDYNALEQPPHRALYLALTLSVELSRGRGLVEPMMQCAGHAQLSAEGASLRLRTDQSEVEGTRISENQWRFTVRIRTH